jgi:hypothetical protein
MSFSIVIMTSLLRDLPSQNFLSATPGGKKTSVGEKDVAFVIYSDGLFDNIITSHNHQ